jgi:polyhydroxybutyrate depolymerase
MSTWLQIGEREKVLVVALQGTRGTNGLAGWNDCRRDDPAHPVADDVAYTRLVIEQVRQKHPVDMRRIYLMGVSNGAMMAYRLAAELQVPVAALAAVAGPLPLASSCTPSSGPLSVLMISGTADPLVPYQGGAVHFGAAETGEVMSVEDSLQHWRGIDHLSERSSVEHVPVRTGSDGKTSATRQTWGSDPHDLQVELIRIDGGGHTEPSIDQVYGRIYLGLAGAQNHDLESADEAWRFFKDKRSTTVSETLR